MEEIHRSMDRYRPNPYRERTSDRVQQARSARDRLNVAIGQTEQLREEFRTTRETFESWEAEILEAERAREAHRARDVHVDRVYTSSTPAVYNTGGPTRHRCDRCGRVGRP